MPRPGEGESVPQSVYRVAPNRRIFPGASALSSGESRLQLCGCPHVACGSYVPRGSIARHTTSSRINQVAGKCRPSGLLPSFPRSPEGCPAACKRLINVVKLKKHFADIALRFQENLVNKLIGNVNRSKAVD